MLPCVKYSTRRDADGIVRLELNNEALFQFGPLDQGWWPDGLYTAPTDEALLYDVQKTKDFGFNMIRKHIKVEPARWYTHCDRLGIIVWQDMPSGDRNPEWQNRRYFDGTELKRSAESGSLLSQGMEGNNGLSLLLSVYRYMGTVQRSLGAVQDGRDSRMDETV